MFIDLSMKKRKIKEIKTKRGFDFNLKWGFKGLEVSFALLLIMVLLLSVLFILSIGDFSRVSSLMLRKPTGNDYLAILAGAILFILVPFLIGIRIGMSLKKH